MREEALLSVAVAQDMVMHGWGEEELLADWTMNRSNARLLHLLVVRGELVWFVMVQKGLGVGWHV